MADPSELADLYRAIEELGGVVGSVRGRYGEIPAVRRLLGDVDRLLLDASELDGVAPPPPPPGQVEMHMIDDLPPDPSLWSEADDEGLGGYRGGSA
jgi:hypothetical protein